MRASFFAEAIWHIVGFEFARPVPVAREFKRKPTSSIGARWIVIEFPTVARTIIADRRGTKLAGDERSNERAARLVLSRNQPHCETNAGVLAIHIEAE